MEALRLILLIVGVVVIFAIYFAGRRGRDSGPRLAYIRDLLRGRRKGADGIPELDISAAVRPAENDPQVLFDEPRDVHGQQGLPDEPAVEPDLGDFEALSGFVAERRPGLPGEAGFGLVPTTDDIALDGSLDPSEQLVLAFYIMAPRGGSFAGNDLQAALEQTGFAYGDMRIFHYYGIGSEAGSGSGAARHPILSLANALEPGTFDPATMEAFTTPGVTLFLQLPGRLEGREAFERLLEVGRALAERLGGELCDDTRSALTPQTVSHLRERVEAFRFKLRMARAGKHRK